ncbi:MAG: 4Fe-4S binding protein [Pseudomonadota bacterium]|nr:4Fe-4S binding protein [Pseudomonadota bacterium]
MEDKSFSSSGSLAEAVDLLEGRELLEDEPLCLNLRGRMEHCDRCAQACHSGALGLSADALEVDHEKCTGCGGCVPACPAGAFRLTGFSPGRFLKALGVRVEVHLHCTESKDSGGGVVIPCFKVLDERLLAAARGAGVEVMYLHGLDRCRGCRQGGALRQVARSRLRVKRWLGDSAPELRPATGGTDVPVVPRQREDQPHLSRRSFLRFAGARAVTSAVQWLVPVEEDEAVPDLPFFQGDPEEIRRPHPYQALLAQQIDQVPWEEGRPLPWRLRTLAEHCTACLSCGRRCPTGALEAGEDASYRGISFEPVLCTDCGLCETLCPADAVQTRLARDRREVAVSRAVLMMRSLQSCSQCGHPFLPDTAEATTCPVCTNEQELDEEWVAMLGG